MSDRIRFAVIGYGHIGKRHAEMVSRNPEAELAAIVDINEGNTTFNERYNVPQFRDLSELLTSEVSADVITLATPNGNHPSHALQALSFYKHVLVEKPLALNPNDARQVIKKANEVDKMVFTVMQNRYSAPSQWIKGLVNSGKLGRIYMVQVNCYWNRDSRYYTRTNWRGTTDLDGGTLFTQFSHFIDMIYWLFGDIQNIQARFADFAHQDLTDFEDSGFMSFEFVKGGMGALTFSTAVWDRNLESSMTVIAENGSVKIGGQYMDKVEYCHVKDYTFSPVESADAASNHQHVIANVVDVLKGRSPVTTTAIEGLKVVDIISRMYADGNRNFKK